MAKFIELQPGQLGEGMGYNPRKELPYPIVVGEDGRCENVPGYPLRNHHKDRELLPILAGFQPDETTQTVTVLPDEWRTDTQVAVGMAPVFFEPGGMGDGMFNLSVLITRVNEYEATEADVQRAAEARDEFLDAEL